MSMASPNQFFLFLILITLTFLISSSSSSSEIGGVRRSLLSFKETPHGGNASFACSPSGPCVPCSYSEKNDEKYRCSETGNRIPLKCLEIKDGSKKESSKKTQKNRSTLDIEEASTTIQHRRMRDISFTPEAGRQAYTTYRSCIPAVNEEKLSVLGFEVIMFGLLLASAPLIYLRRRQTVAMAGVAAGRVQTNSRY